MKRTNIQAPEHLPWVSRPVNPFVPNLTIEEIKKISETVLESRRKQYLARMGGIVIEEKDMEEFLNVKDSFVFQIKKFFGLTSKAQTIINSFPFGDLLLKISTANWNKNSQSEKATFFWHFMQEMNADSESYPLILASIVFSLKEDPNIYTSSFLEENAIKEIPIFLEEKPDVIRQVSEEQAIKTPLAPVTPKSKARAPSERSPKLKRVRTSDKKNQNQIILDTIISEFPFVKDLRKSTVIRDQLGVDNEKILLKQLRNKKITNSSEVIAFLNSKLQEKSDVKTVELLAAAPIPPTPSREEIDFAKRLKQLEQEPIKTKTPKKTPKKIALQTGDGFINLLIKKNYNMMKPDMLFRELTLHLGSRAAGNDSLKKPIASIVKAMHKQKLISLKEAKQILKI
jgi:hypothetical protein